MAIYNYFMLENPKYIYVDKNFRGDDFEQVVTKFLERNSFEYVSGDGQYLEINRKDGTYTYTDTIETRPGITHIDRYEHFEKLVNDLSHYPLVYIKLEKLIDNQISSDDLLKLERLVNDYGFKIVNEDDKFKSNYIRVDYYNDTIHYCISCESEHLLTTFERHFKNFHSLYADPSYTRHEALHTANLFCENIADHLIEHHYFHQNINPEYNKHIQDAFDSLWAAYQSVGDEDKEVKKYLKKIH